MDVLSPPVHKYFPANDVFVFSVTTEWIVWVQRSDQLTAASCCVSVDLRGFGSSAHGSCTRQSCCKKPPVHLSGWAALAGVGSRAASDSHRGLLNVCLLRRLQNQMLDIFSYKRCVIHKTHFFFFFSFSFWGRWTFDWDHIHLCVPC